MEENLNKVPGSIRIGTVVRAHRTLSGNRRQSATCGKTGHYASDCKTNGPKFAFAPKVIRMNYLQRYRTRKAITLRVSRTTARETNRSLCRDPYYSSQGFYSSQSPFIFIFTPEYSSCVDRSPTGQPPRNRTLRDQ